VGTGPGAEVGTRAGRGEAAVGMGGEVAGRKSRAAPMAGAMFPRGARGGWGGAMSVTRGGQGDSSRPPVPKATPATREGLRGPWEARAGQRKRTSCMAGAMFLGAPTGDWGG